MKRMKQETRTPMRLGANLIKNPFCALRGKFGMWLLAGTVMLCLAVVARAALSLTGAGATFPYPMYSKVV